MQLGKVTHSLLIYPVFSRGVCLLVLLPAVIFLALLSSCSCAPGLRGLSVHFLALRLLPILGSRYPPCCACLYSACLPHVTSVVHVCVHSFVIPVIFYSVIVSVVSTRVVASVGRYRDVLPFWVPTCFSRGTGAVPLCVRLCAILITLY